MTTLADGTIAPAITTASLQPPPPGPHASAAGRTCMRRRDDWVELCGIRTRVPAMKEMLDTVELVADLDAPVLICGETGTGKELVARALHALGRRSRNAMVTIQCGALPESLAESELFGHERGTFTGAERSYAGRLVAAHNGTAFLDEVNSLSLVMQTKLLRFLDTQEVSRIGRPQPIGVDVRLVSATNAPLQDLVAAGAMRQDFYYRLNVLTINVCPLRERLADIPLLVERFLAHDPLARRAGVTHASDDVIAELMTLPWPGNVRELQNLIRRSLVYGVERGVLRRIDTVPGTRPFAAVPTPAPKVAPLTGFRAWMREREREYFIELIKRHRSVAEQGRASGLPERTLYRKIQSLRRTGARLVTAGAEAANDASLGV